MLDACVRRRRQRGVAAAGLRQLPRCWPRSGSWWRASSPTRAGFSSCRSGAHAVAHRGGSRAGRRRRAGRLTPKLGLDLMVRRPRLWLACVRRGHHFSCAGVRQRRDGASPEDGAARCSRLVHRRRPHSRDPRRHQRRRARRRATARLRVVALVWRPVRRLHRERQLRGGAHRRDGVVLDRLHRGAARRGAPFDAIGAFFRPLAPTPRRAVGAVLSIGAAAAYTLGAPPRKWLWCCWRRSGARGWPSPAPSSRTVALCRADFVGRYVRLY